MAQIRMDQVATAPLLCTSHSFLQVPFEPGDNAIEYVKLVLLFAEAVTFAWIKDEIRFHPIAFQSAIKLLTLAHRIGDIVLALQDQSRRARILNVGDRRTL